MSKEQAADKSSLPPSTPKNHITFLTDTNEDAPFFKKTPGVEQPLASDAKLSKKKTFREMIEKSNDIRLSLEDAARSAYEFEKFQIAEVSVAISTLVGIFTSVLAYDVEFDDKDDALLNYLLILILFISVLTIALNVMRYLQKIKYCISRNLLPIGSTLVSSGEIKNVLLETFTLILQPFPFNIDIIIESSDKVEGVAFQYRLNDIFYVLMMARLVIIIRVMLNLTKYMSPRAGRITELYGAEANYSYAIKCLMKKYPMSAVSMFFVTSIFVFAHMLRICERPLANTEATAMRLSNYANAMWCIVITMSTIGYGDFYAKTIYGRIISFSCCIWGVFITSIIVVTLTNILTMNSAEEKGFIILQRLRLRKEIKTQAASAITGLTKLAANKFKGQTDDEARNQKLLNKIKVSLAERKQLARQVKMLEYNGDIKEQMMYGFSYLRNELKEIEQKQNERHNNLAKSIKEIADIVQNIKATSSGKMLL